jgi:hypothetical protein
MYAVAVCELAADLEAEAIALGALAGIMAYDVKMCLSASGLWPNRSPRANVSS